MASAIGLPGVLGYVVGRLVSTIGRSMPSIALGWQLYERTGSAFMLGLVGLVQIIPVVGLVIVAGNAADRYSRRKIGALTQLVHAAVALGIAAVSATHGPVALIYLLLFVAGAAQAFASPAISALLPALVPTAQLAELNAWSSMAFQLAASAGPALAGLLLAALGDATPLYLAEAVAAFAFAVILWRLPT